jgi:hypothetical protein
MAALSHFVRLARSADLLDHVRRFEGDFEGSENMEPSTIAEMISKSCSGAQRDRLVAELERAGGMADEIGQAAMLALPDWRAELLQIESAYARAHWLFLQSQDAFRHAEEIRYVDENQNSRRMWTGFVAPRDLGVDLGTIQLDAMSRAVREAFGDGRFHIEPIERLQPHDPDGRRSIQLTIYSEDLPVDQLEFIEEGLTSRPRRPVRETAIVYDGESGTIEVVSKRQEMRHTFATLFAEHCLGINLSGEKLPLLMLDLMPLIDPHPFPTEPKDGIAKVKLTILTLSPSDERLTQQFQVTFDDPRRSMS